MREIKYEELVKQLPGTYIGIVDRYKKGERDALGNYSYIYGTVEEPARVVRIVSVKTIGLFKARNKQVIVEAGDGTEYPLFWEYSGEVSASLGLELGLLINRELLTDRHLKGWDWDDSRYSYEHTDVKIVHFDNAQEVKDTLRTYESTKQEREAEKIRFDRMYEEKKQKEADERL